MLTWMVHYLQETVQRPQRLYTEPVKSAKIELNTVKRTRQGAQRKFRKDTLAERKIANLLDNGVRKRTIIAMHCGMSVEINLS